VFADANFKGSGSISDERVVKINLGAVPESLAITRILRPEVYLDNSLVGNAPATLKLASGKHTVTAKLAGIQDWSRISLPRRYRGSLDCHYGEDELMRGPGANKDRYVHND